MTSKIGYARVSGTGAGPRRGARGAQGGWLRCHPQREGERDFDTGARPTAHHPRLHPRWRRADGHAHRQAGKVYRRPAGHRPRAEGERARRSRRPSSRSTRRGPPESVSRHTRRVREFETNLRRERQIEGIAAAKARASTRAARRLSRPRSPRSGPRASARRRSPSVSR